MSTRPTGHDGIACPHPRCNAFNPPTARYCRRCGRQLLGRAAKVGSPAVAVWQGVVLAIFLPVAIATVLSGQVPCMLVGLVVPAALVYSLTREMRKNWPRAVDGRRMMPPGETPGKWSDTHE